MELEKVNLKFTSVQKMAKVRNVSILQGDSHMILNNEIEYTGSKPNANLVYDHKRVNQIIDDIGTNGYPIGKKV